MQDAFRAYAAGFEAWAQACAPFAKTAARVQIEAMAYANRRARFHLDLPGRAAQCRTPEDWMALHSSYWRETFEQWSESSTRIAQALSAQAPFGPPKPEPAARRPDYIVFPAERARSGSAPTPPGRIAETLR